jgi:hypothetical protein
MHNVLRESAGPSSYAKRRISFENESSVRRFVLNEKILKHIKHCTEIEAVRRSGDNNWKLSLDELDSFISLLYIRGALHAKGLSTDALWSTKWGNRYFNETMSQKRFKEVMRYLRFDIKSTRSQRLLNDRFTLVSEVWNNFIEKFMLL